MTNRFNPPVRRSNHFSSAFILYYSLLFFFFLLSHCAFLFVVGVETFAHGDSVVSNGFMVRMFACIEKDIGIDRRIGKWK